ncbi:hypothetical protein [Evansella cellulosilytica]|uniref:Peptidyl-prolyl cis-trans isomerase n=1 Tax=Evansella cellulosilytica (strain ATCC 21833 / DSM 2522 / FERM P-1141 / JCM 9156 / N-4) TaxID=649639 RepID=E6TUL2_EVAC2|nr:hypothetical protein [Evansella cellulosilytica]ADU30902.1 hypothetical protein Bcell_2647 [Evansella cellulosilytica DSM 2522]
MVFLITGNVKHTITIDPGVWIFDERKVDLATYFSEDQISTQEQELMALGKTWDMHRKEGANALQKGNGNAITVSKKDLTEKSFGIPILPFLSNAIPNGNAEKVIFKRADKEDFICSMKEAETAILGFSSHGQPLKENGPVHFYYGDGTNKDNPITDIYTIEVV